MKIILILALVLVVLGIGSFIFLDQQAKKPRFIDDGGLTIPMLRSTSPQITENSETPQNLIKLAFVQKYGEDAQNMEVSVTQNLGEYAKGLVNDPNGGGGMWFATKQNGEWVLVWDGNGIIECSDLTEFPDFPNSLIPQCYDQASEKLINR